MNYFIKNPGLLKKLLWVDTFLGGTTAIIGLVFYNTLTGILGLSATLIVTVSGITLGYAVVAIILSTQYHISIPLLRILIYANWFWTLVSIGLVYLHFEFAQPLGKAFLVLQVFVVGLLAYFEGKQLTVSKTYPN